MRGTGRTKNMVEHLPATGSAVVVHSNVMRSYVASMIRDLRGAAVFKVTRIFVVEGPRDVDLMLGLRVPIFCDHAFMELGHREAILRVTYLRDGVNAMLAHSN